MPVNRPLSPSLRSQAAGFQGQVDDSWTKLRPGTSPAACTSPGSESLRTARPWTVSLASVKSFTSGSLAADSWSELLSKGFENDGLGGLGPAIPEPLNPKTEIKSRSLVTKVAETCDEYRLRKREDDLRAFHGICSNMSFRRPRGMDILSDRARAARKPPEPLADGFVVRGPTGQTASEIATQTPLLQTLDSEHFTLITRLIEAEAMHFVSVIGGQLLFREKDPVENAYIVLSGSVQQYSEDHNFLRSMGWHPHEQTEEDEKLRLNRQASSRSQLGDVASAMDCLEDEEEVNPKDFLTLTEYVRKKGMPDLQQRFRTLEGHSTFCQDGSYGNLYNTATSGSLVGEPALKAEKLWRSTAMCSGRFCASFLAAFGFNGKLFTGSFDQRDQLDFSQYVAVFLGPAALTSVSCIFLIEEKKAQKGSMRQFWRSSFHLMEGRAFASIATYLFLSSSIFGIRTNAGTWVSIQWANVKIIQSQLAGLVGIIFVALGTWLTQKYFLNVSWRKIILGASLAIAFFDAIPQFLTIFDILRDPYFYLGEPIAKEVPVAMMALVTNLIANEVADEENCAMVIGVLKSISSIANPLAVLLSNQIFGSFHPSITERQNYIEDHPSFRLTVAETYLLSYALSLFCLFFLPLLPSQKADAQRRKRDWPYRRHYAIIGCVVLSSAFLYAFVGDVLILDKNLACLRFLGGKGC